MAVGIETVTDIIEEMAPLAGAYDWDNSGLVVRAGDTVSAILVALDATVPVVRQAAENGCDMILTHHPLMFSPIRRIDCREAAGRVIAGLLQNGISLYCAHTSMDRAEGGINDVLCEKLGLTDVANVTEPDGYACARVGTLPHAMAADELVRYIRERIGCDSLRVSGDAKVARLGVCGGSGGSLTAAVKAAGADGYLTGELHYNEHADGAGGGFVLLEAGHAETERQFVETAFDRLQRRINELQYNIRLVRAEDICPYRYY